MTQRNFISLKNRTIFFVTASILSLVILKQVISQIVNFTSAEKAMAKHDYIQAVDDYTEVIYNHLPFSPLERIAISRCFSLFDFAKAKEDYILQLYILEQVRRAIYGVRHFTIPHREALKRVEEELSKVRATMLVADGYAKPFEETLNEIKVVMSKDLSPNGFISILCVTFFVLYIYSTIMVIRALEIVPVVKVKVAIRLLFAGITFALFLISAFYA